MSQAISSIAYGDADVLESMAEMKLNTLEQSGFDERTYLLVRIASLVAMDAPAESYAIGLAGIDEGLEVEDLEGLLVALAPVVGSARAASAASSILDVFFDDGAEDEGVEDEAPETEDDAEEAEDDAREQHTEVQVEEPTSEYALDETQDEERDDEESALQMA